MGGCLCGRGMRAKIDEPGCQRVSLAINVAGDDRDAIAGCRTVNHSVAWSKSQSKSVIRFGEAGKQGQAFGDFGDGF